MVIADALRDGDDCVSDVSTASEELIFHGLNSDGRDARSPGEASMPTQTTADSAALNEVPPIALRIEFVAAMGTALVKVVK